MGQKRENKDLLICLSIYLDDVGWQVGKKNEEIWSVGKRSVLLIASENSEGISVAHERCIIHDKLIISNIKEMYGRT